MDVPLQQQRLSQMASQNPTSKIVAWTIVAIVHVAFIWAFGAGLAKTAVNLLHITEAALIQEQSNDDVAPPPPPKIDQLPDAYVPAPDVNIDVAQNAPTPTAPVRVVSEAPVASTAPILPPKGTNQNRVDPNDYPPVSRRLNEQGTVMAKVTVSATGTVTGCEIAKTSGYPRLDGAACQLVKNKFHYAAATQDGKNVDWSGTIPVQYRLQ